MMKIIPKLSFFVLVGLLTTNINAQSSFTHGPGNEIETSFFNAELAPFYHGVASGDPLQDKLIIWTRVTPVSDTIVPVKWIMATDTSFQNVIAQGQTTTDYTKDYTVKIDVVGLEPNVTYYYYFTALNKNSLIGRTHTLAGSGVNHLRFAVGSCSNYQMGYFNSYKQISKHNDLDAVLHLGDYLYEYPTYGYGYTVEVDRTHRPNDEIITLNDYRIRHSFYKLDADLRAAHQQQPFICVWDDHEIANNTYESGAENHTDETEGDFQTRKESAIRAYMEWMPIRVPQYIGGNPQIYRSFKIGNLADIFMVDTRVEDRDKQAYSATDPLFQDTTREILGEEQREWLFDEIDNSVATWKIYGNQVMMSQEGENNSDVDAWTGYPFEREKIIDKLLATGDKNHVILTGDTHRSWSFDLSKHPFDSSYYQPFTGNGTFGVEFAAPSLASPNRNESSPGTSPVPFQQALLTENPHLRYSDLDNHGYFILDLTNLKAQADFHYVDTKFSSEKDSVGKSWFTYKDQGFLQEALQPATGKVNQAIPAPSNPLVYSNPSTNGLVEMSNSIFISGVYPNPTVDYLMVGLTLNKSETITMKLFDVNGKICLEQELFVNLGHQKIRLNLPSTLQSGIYHLGIQVNAYPQMFMKKINVTK